MKIFEYTSNGIAKITLLLYLFLIVYTGHSQVGDLIWEEEFENLDNWIHEYGNGSWGWGNGELEFYKPENAVD